MLDKLGLEDVPEDLSKQCAYETLCKWKEKNNFAQTKLLKDALDEAKIEQSWKVMTEQKKKRNKAAVDHVLEQLLKDIGHQDQIDQVITTLNRGRTTGSPGHRNIPDALAKLKEWSKGQLQEDPLVLLSCALEWTRISPLDRTFFTGRKVSFYELWSLAYNTAWDKENPLHCFLGFKDTKVTKQTTYEALWKWKEEHKYEDQMQILKDALSGTGDADILRRMINEHGVDTFPTVPTHTLQRILRDVDSLGKTEQFLHELCPHKQHSNTDASAVLEKWSNGPFTENPVILLSTALEKAGCEPLDRSFFTVPENLQHPISKQEVKDCVLKLTGRHSTRLANVLSITDKEKLLLTTSENNEMLFDTESMIHALITSMKCTNYAKRCRLDDALMKIGRHDMRNCFGTTEFLRPIGNPPHKKHPNSDQFDHESAFADDMMHMMENLPKDSSATFCKILTLPVRDDGKDETRFDEEHQEGINHTWTENQRHVTLRVCIALFDKMLEDFISKGQEKRPSLLASIPKKLRRKSKGNYDDSTELMMLLDKLEEYRNIPEFKAHDEREEECNDKERENDVATSPSTTEQCKTTAPTDGNEEEPVGEGQRLLLSTLEDGTDSRSGTQGDRQDDGPSSEADDRSKQSANEIKENAQIGEKEDKVDPDSGNITIPMNQKVFSNDGESENEWLEQQQSEIRDGSDSEIAGTTGSITGSNWTDSNPDGTNSESNINSKNPNVALSPPTSEHTHEKIPVIHHKTQRPSQDTKTYYEARQKLLAPAGLKDGIVKLSPAKYMYEAELAEAAFSMLMRDVLPLIRALDMDPAEVSKHRKCFSVKINEGSVGLLLQLLQVKTKTKKNIDRRLEFCLALQNIGYLDVASSVYCGYKPSLSELYNTLTDLWERERSWLAGYLILSKKDIAKCTDDNGKMNHLHVMRKWRNQIRPTPCHYRVELAAGLREAGRKDIANKVLSGHYRKAGVNVDVLRDICRRLTEEETGNLCKVLNLKLGNVQTEMVIDWVSRWINKVALKGAKLDKQKEHRDVNNKLVEAGFYELAEEIMLLEFGFF